MGAPRRLHRRPSCEQHSASCLRSRGFTPASAMRAGRDTNGTTPATPPRHQLLSPGFDARPRRSPDEAAANLGARELTLLLAARVAIVAECHAAGERWTPLSRPKKCRP